MLSRLDHGKATRDLEVFDDRDGVAGLEFVAHPVLDHDGIGRVGGFAFRPLVGAPGADEKGTHLVDGRTPGMGLGCRSRPESRRVLAIVELRDGPVDGVHHRGPWRS